MLAKNHFEPDRVVWVKMSGNTSNRELAEYSVQGQHLTSVMDQHHAAIYMKGTAQGIRSVHPNLLGGGV